SKAEEAEKVVLDMKQLGSNAKAIQNDISCYREVEAMMEEVLKDYGQIDLLVNNAGITKDQLMLRMTEDDFSQVVDINLKGSFNCVKAVTKSMFKKRSGNIINISSVVGLIGNVGQVNYAASKAGVIGMTKSLAREYAARNIRVNAIAPGFIDTDMTESLSAELKEKIVNNIPLNALGKPEDIADMVVFLASDKAKYVTGQVIAVDGGMTM
ncbi:MAG: 3-oxoacyl-[acyl-carrier-protein] reductase, partial [Vallitaleaceae bacterium]|nr:3-oxoacyl-[acyl-carrier-protein] reductase [Vallitaleaceae bacterium]